MTGIVCSNEECSGAVVKHLSQSAPDLVLFASEVEDGCYADRRVSANGTS